MSDPNQREKYRLRQKARRERLKENGMVSVSVPISQLAYAKMERMRGDETQSQWLNEVILNH